MFVSSDVRDGYSDKEVVQFTEPSPIEHPLTLDTDRLSCSSSFATFPTTGEPIWEKFTDQEGHAHTFPRLERSDSRVSSIKRMSARLARSISVSISNLSDGLSLINSIMSRSISWRSRLAYAMTISSVKLSNLSGDAFSREELHIWDELVDESKLESESPCQFDIGAVSLYSRPGCSFFEDIVDEARKECPTCGFSKIHQLARLSECNYLGGLSLLDDMPTDRFGNTVLHHAPAAGNLERVLKLIASQDKESKPLLQLRNTSGETFLHVLRLKRLSAFPEYLQILRETRSRKFGFGTQTYYRKSVFDQFKEVMHDLNLEPIRFTVAIHRCILGLHDVDDEADIIRAQQLQELVNKVKEFRAARPLRTKLARKFSALSIPLYQRKTALNRLKNDLTNTSTTQFMSSDCFDIADDRNNALILLRTLKNWGKHSKSSSQLLRMIEKSGIHVRDELGYTALAIAARQGIYMAVSLLLQHGANPNTRSWQKTSVLSHAAVYLARAQKANNERLYTKILSCMTLLLDYGAREQVSVLKEYSVYFPPSFKGKDVAQHRRSSDKNHETQDSLQEVKYAKVYSELPRESLHVQARHSQDIVEGTVYHTGADDAFVMIGAEDNWSADVLGCQERDMCYGIGWGG